MANNVGPVQVPLAGLYGMLGVKDGSNPDVITGFVQPTLDATRWWLRASQQNLTVAMVVNATGAIVNHAVVFVPQNEWWYVAHFTAFLQLDIATVAPGYFVRIRVQEAALPNFYYTTPPIPLITDAAGNVYYQQGPGVANPHAELRDFWLPPGSRVYVDFQGNIANPDTCTISPIYGVKCRV